MYVVEHYRHSVARSFGQPNISWYDGFKHLRTEKTAQIGGNLLRQSCAVIVHREQDTFDREGRIDRAPETHERVEQFRNAL
jgi:hypothetical protein